MGMNALSVVTLKEECTGCLMFIVFRLVDIFVFIFSCETKDNFPASAGQ